MDEGRWLKSGFRPRREREREGERESECRHEGETLKILFSGASACGARAQRAHKHAYMGNVTTCFCDLLHSRVSLSHAKAGFGEFYLIVNRF